MSEFRIGLFYGSTTCYTEIAAEKIREFIGADIVQMHNIKDIPLKTAEQFDVIIFGLSTWDFGEIQEDWESHWDEIRDLDLSNKTIALYGMGDQQGYSEWFQDALGMLHDEIAASPGGSSIHRIGYWPVESYEFIASKALIADKTHFVGLALDEDSQYELSDERIETWCTQILEEIAAT
ncbi:flavodoxin FldB [Aliidiomarina halalkaliphila]|uniref:Flavodoxin n=1 Tax=Aliidiomarina halalkaliphila TaxID=2593535 RepID=A0A552X2R9_9GAMM|nr:flavodoxin FldB [Aliidiomarina halalkaliphila]TRW49328.1 flavodoxin FldB [Aliidiomarina halalkaliphila]